MGEFRMKFNGPNVDWSHVSRNLSHMSDRQKQEVLRTAIIYENITWINKLLNQGIRPMSSHYKFINNTAKGDAIRRMLP